MAVIHQDVSAAFERDRCVGEDLAIQIKDAGVRDGASPLQSGACRNVERPGIGNIDQAGSSARRGKRIVPGAGCGQRAACNVGFEPDRRAAQGADGSTSIVEWGGADQVDDAARLCPDRAGIIQSSGGRLDVEGASAR